jgi:divalent metal cation (Fe/Co/Zn/Cd) transporter
MFSLTSGRDIKVLAIFILGVLSLRFFGYIPFHIAVELSSILIGLYIFYYSIKLRKHYSATPCQDSII